MNGQALPVAVMVTGDEPRMVNDEHEAEPEQDADVVATVPSVFAPVQYARLPIVGALEVPMPR